MAMILASKMQSFLALVGAFVLAVMVVSSPDTPRIIASGLFDILVFLPLIILQIRQ
jgi:hypothetical protein